jgi:hypothetical protein
MSDKKFGSVKDIKKKGNKVPFWDKFWDYKPYILGFIILIAASLIFLLVYKNLTHGTESLSQKPTPVATDNKANTGKLVVTTNPDGASVNIMGRTEKSPATFIGLPEGELITVISLHNYKTVTRNVKLENGKITKLDVTLEKN